MVNSLVGFFLNQVTQLFERLSSIRLIIVSGIFFQDARMAEMYQNFPELILFDATYKLNNRDMPLVLQLCVDGNGETEIISLFVCNSESQMSIGCMIDAFQECNEAWRQTRVILGDKDFADRAIYSEKFPDAELQICLFHTLVTFKREITPDKRDITAAEKVLALEILEKLAYSRSSRQYDELHDQLLDLELPLVTDYYNKNWHNIKGNFYFLRSIGFIFFWEGKKVVSSDWRKGMVLQKIQHDGKMLFTEDKPIEPEERS